MSGALAVVGLGIVGYFVFRAVQSNVKSSRMAEMQNDMHSTNSAKGWSEICNEIVSPTRIRANLLSLPVVRTEPGPFGTTRQVSVTDSGGGYTVPMAAGFLNQL